MEEKKELHTDACKQGYGAILLQEAEDGKLHPVYYMSKKTNAAEEKEHIQHLQIATGIPRGNGQVERIHRTLIPVLTKLSFDDSTKWYQYVDRLQRILNSTICCSTKWTPFELLVGTKMRNKEDILIKDLLLEEMVKELLEREFLRNDAKKNIETLQSENRKTYNRGRKRKLRYTKKVI
ncbi:pro-Pol polyprotein [Trichonephila clavipes]|nr:pro-Pol polyprotein [Trichonephila clavipes]